MLWLFLRPGRSVPSSNRVRGSSPAGALHFSSKIIRARDSLSGAMEKPKPERRSSTRVPLSVPVAVRASNQAGELSATTRDLSSNGIFLYTQSKMQAGSRIELVLILPPELANGERRWACCQASVVRVENGPDSGFGVAATLDSVDLLPEIEG